MRTWISIPDEILARASARARDLGSSRSEFFTAAAQTYLDELDAGSVTRRIDAVLAQLEEVDESALADA